LPDKSLGYGDDVNRDDVSVMVGRFHDIIARAGDIYRHHLMSEFKLFCYFSFSFPRISFVEDAIYRVHLPHPKFFRKKILRISTVGS